MATSANIPTFHGDERDEKNDVNSEEFLRRFRIRTREVNRDSDEQRIEAIEDYFGVNSPAAIWWADRQDNVIPIDKFDDFVREFKAKFPTAAAAKLSAQEYQQKLAEMTITLEELGTTVEVAGTDVDVHVKFANKLMQAATKAGIEATSSYIYQVRNALPEPLRKKIPADVANWKAFTAAIKGVERVELREGVEEAELKKNKEMQIEKRIRDLANAQTRAPPATPMTKLANQLNTAGLKTPKPAGAGAGGRDAFGGGGGRGNLFTPRQDLDETGIQKLRELVARISVPPTTKVGREFYKAQIDAWDKEYGGRNPRALLEEVGYPLSPGTAAPGTGECFRCGHLTAPRHARDACAAEEIPCLETAFREICNKYLRAPRFRPQQNVAQVNYLDMKMPDSDDESDEEGFGRGLSD
ncbi:hypothetical protein C8F01DRAFT_1370852 [Mycena amicta]|nr:hypothetical protein C8F01DRAFT_1370852 [Mycena amicta]